MIALFYTWSTDPLVTTQTCMKAESAYRGIVGAGYRASHSGKEADITAMLRQSAQASTSGRNGRVVTSAGSARARPRARAPAAVVQPQAKDVLNTTYHPKGKDQENAKKRWYLVDADGMRVGRLATVVADTIRGKDVASYTPSADMGSYVIVINAEKVDITGNKRMEKMYKRHTTGRPGTMKVCTLAIDSFSCA